MFKAFSRAYFGLERNRLLALAVVSVKWTDI